MELNFYLELAALVIGIILCFVTSVRYNTIDLKDKIYVSMVRMITIILGCNMLSYAIVHNNYYNGITLAEAIIGVSFFIIVWFFVCINKYLYESIYSTNCIDYKVNMLISLPGFFNLILVLQNIGTHNVYDVVRVDNEINIFFNTWYSVPYVLAACGMIIYLFMLIFAGKSLKEKKQYIFYIIPILMIGIYYLQYHNKAKAILGFGYIIILLLLYLYSYDRLTKIDSLTSLPDGAAFKKMLDYRIGQKRSMTVGMITLNDFKQVNYEYGYNNGNHFLQMIAEYLEERAPKQCMARYSGDKFAVIFDEQNAQEVKAWCDGIISRFDEAWEFGKICHKLSVCITLVEYPALTDSSEQILEVLEYMNTYGKQNKRSQIILCNDEFKVKMNRRLRITSILNDVVQEGKMYVEYQPILEVSENAFTRAEALFRLKDEELGDISPMEFFPIAEENGYIIDIGYTLIEKVCQYMKNMRDEGEKLPIISINFFRQQFMADNLEQKLSEILGKYEIPAQNIAFELPETVFAVKYDEVKDQMLKLSQSGYRFYLDGFGNAFLDLTHLMELPFEIIKIDKKMIRQAENNESIYLLVSALTAVFEENGKMILGDGIESESLKGMVDLLFMDYLQGHYFCEPISGELVREQFRKKNVVEGMADLNQILDEMDLDDENAIVE